MKRLFVMLLIVAMVLAVAACGSEDTNTTTSGTTEPSTTTSGTTEPSGSTGDETVVMTYAQYVAAAIDEEVVIEAYVQAHQSWWDNKIVVYAQDADGAYFIYNMACSEEDAAKLTAGTKIRVTGYKGEYKGEIEILDATFEFVDSDPWTATALDVTDLLGTDELINYQNMFVAFKGATVTASTIENDETEYAFLYSWNGSGTQGDDLYFNVEINGKVYTFCVESYLCDKDTDVYKAVEALKVGDVIDMEGFLYWYDGVNPHITSVKTAE